MPQNSGTVRIDELTAHATWEQDQESLVVKFDAKRMTPEQLATLIKVRRKSDTVAIQLPARTPKRCQIVGFDNDNHSVHLAIGGAE